MDTSLQAARARVCDLVDGLLAVDLPNEDRPEVASAVAGALGRALVGALASMAALHEDSSVDAHALDLPLGPEADISLHEAAFIARLELRHYGGWLLEQVGPLDLDELLDRCERLRRHAVQVLVSVEQRLAHALGEPPRLGDLPARSLARSRAVRQAYYRLITAIETLEGMRRDGHWQHDTVVWAGALALAELLADPCLPDLRRDDRQRIEALQQRLLTWHRPPIRDQLEARRLWRDLRALAHRLAAVQRRRELIEHDLGVIDDLLWAGQLERSLAQPDGRLLELATRSPELATALERSRAAEIGRALAQVHDALARVLGRPSLAARRSAADVVTLCAP